MKFFHRRIGRLFVIVGMFGALAAGTSGCFRHGTPEQKIEYVKNKVANKLDLNDEQKKILDKAKEPLHALLKEQEDLRSKHLSELKNALERGGKVESDLFLSLYGDRRDSFDKYAPKFAEIFSELSATLTPEQRTELQELVTKWENRRRHHKK